MVTVTYPAVEGTIGFPELPFDADFVVGDDATFLISHDFASRSVNGRVGVLGDLVHHFLELVHFFENGTIKAAKRIRIGQQ